LATFVEIGSALSEIRDQRLYRLTSPTFESYCRQKWAMAASRARQLIGAAEVVSNLQDKSVTTVTISTSGKSVTAIPLPLSERQTRALSGLASEQQRQVWEKSVETAQGVPSEQQIRTIREALFPSTPKRRRPERRQTGASGVSGEQETPSAELRETPMTALATSEQETPRTSTVGGAAIQESLPLEEDREHYETEPAAFSPPQSRYEAFFRVLRALPDPIVAAELASPEDLNTLAAARNFFTKFYRRLQERFPQPQLVAGP
jgi:hypothetical protein